MADTEYIQRGNSGTVTRTQYPSGAELVAERAKDFSEVMSGLNRLRVGYESDIQERDTNIKTLEDKVGKLERLLLKKGTWDGQDGVTFAQRAEQNEAKIKQLSGILITRDEQIAKMRTDAMARKYDTHKECKEEIERWQAEATLARQMAGSHRSLTAMMQDKEKALKKDLQELVKLTNSLKQENADLGKRVEELEELAEPEKYEKFEEMKNTLKEFTETYTREEWIGFGKFGEKVLSLADLADR